MQFLSVIFSFLKLKIVCTGASLCTAVFQALARTVAENKQIIFAGFALTTRAFTSL